MTGPDPHVPFVATATPEWVALEAAARRLEATDLRALFAADPDRVDTFSWTVGDLWVDLSRQRLDAAVLGDLVGLARRAAVADRFAGLMAGRHLNVTEDRAVLHPALRLPDDASLVVDGRDVAAEARSVRRAAGRAATAIRDGSWRGATGERIRAVVSLGIGGSDLGPAMATLALDAFGRDDLEVRFASNVDGTDLLAALDGLDPATTVVVVVSKTFTTAETLANAQVARRWLVERVGQDGVGRHLVAVSADPDRAAAFGVDPGHVFGFWDWVGGRYSLASAVGFALQCAIGPEAFDDLLAGMHLVDVHMADTPLEDNVAVLAGLVGFWNQNLLGAASVAVLPYSHELRRFPAYLQQLDMESNGKSVRVDGSPVDLDTGSVLWGEPGTNGQHAFHQLLHQGTRRVPVEFIGFVNATRELGDHQDVLLANLGAQAAALAFGRTAGEVAAAGVASELVAHRTFPGNRPSTVVLAPRLTPSVLGQLIALHEHRVFTQGVLWGINSFDQWGVELGKQLAGPLAAALTDPSTPLDGFDAATAALVDRARSLRTRETPSP